MSDLPPPIPSPVTESKRLPPRVLIVCLILLAAVAIFVGNRGGDTADKRGSKGLVTYGWQSGNCDDSGFEGRLTNRSGQVATFRVWAEAFDDQRRQIDRDSEVVFDLEPGQTETVQFVFSSAEVARCSVAEIEVVD